MRRFATAWLAAWLLAILAGCSGQKVSGPPDSPLDRPVGQSDFDTPSNGSDAFSRGGDAEAAGAPGAPAPADNTAAAAPAPDRVIEEADLYKVVGDKIFALNRYRGLYIIDLADLSAPKVVGRAPIFGYPVEMYVRDSRAYIIVTDYYRFAAASSGADFAPVRAFYGSQVRVVDISNMQSPVVVGGIDLEGELTDSRIVGDVLYAVSNRYPWYYRYSDESNPVDKTQILSISIADPSNVHVVDTKDFPRNGWEHHIYATANTIYVASSGYPQNNWRNGYQTRIRLVDIRDPGGQIVLRGEAIAQGRVQDRWSMNEHEKVLRVASGQSWGNGDVYLTTYAVENPDDVRQLGQYTLHVNENLTAARFDGTHGYLVSYRNIDPLFTFDLTDPADPQLTGELEMSGWLDFMVPMGDRIVALGHEDLNVEGRRMISLAVSLIDVTTGQAPKLLSRVSLDGAWGWIPGDRDDFAKVFKVLGSQGLVVFPFQAWNRQTYRYDGGVQLIDFNRDTLTRRGLIANSGWVERGIPYQNDKVLTLANQLFQTVDISDRDNPRVLGRLELARNVQGFSPLPGDKAVQLSGDWYLGDTKLSVTSQANPDDVNPISSVRVPAPYGRLFTNGSMAYVASVHDQYDGAGNYTGRLTKLKVIDLSDPANPRERGELTLPEEVQVGYHYWYWGSGDEVAQVNGSTLVFHRYRYYYYYDCIGCGGPSGGADQTHKLFVVDLSNPDRPALASTVALQDASWAWGLKAKGNFVYLSEYRTVQRDNNWFNRYFLRRIDVSDPSAPQELPRINIPGMFVEASADGQYLYTLESWWDSNRRETRTLFHSLALHGSQAYLRSSVELPGYVNNVQVTGSAAFASSHWYGYREVDGNQQWYTQSVLAAIDLSNPRSIRIASQTQIPYDYAWLQKVVDGRAFISSGAGVFTYNVNNPAEPVFERFFRTQGWSQDIVVKGARAFLPSGYYGVQVLNLGSGASL